MTSFGVFVAVIVIIVTIYRVRKNHTELQNLQLLEEQLRLQHQDLLQLQALIDEKRQELGTRVRHWFVIQPCSRCHEFKMKLLEISPNGRSVHYQCENCQKKMRAAAATPDAPQLTESQNELSTLNDKFRENARQFTKDTASCLRKGGCAPIGDFLWGPRVVVVFEAPAAPLPYEQTTRTAIPEAIRSEVWRRDSGQCVQCASKQNLQFDHIIPVSRGGATSVANLQLLCQPCNGTKSNKI